MTYEPIFDLISLLVFTNRYKQNTLTSEITEQQGKKTGGLLGKVATSTYPASAHSNWRSVPCTRGIPGMALIFLSHSKHIPGEHPQLSHDRFLPHPLQFIAHLFRRSSISRYNVYITPRCKSPSKHTVAYSTVAMQRS
jgi:hypothetical protein